MKLNWKTIFIESIGIVLLISGLKRVYFSSQHSLHDKIDNISAHSISKYMLESSILAIGILLLSIVIIGLLKRKIRGSILNTTAIFVIIISLFFLGFFNKGIINSLFNSIGYLFFNEATTAYILSGITLITIGLSLLFLNIKTELKNHTHIQIR